jgi:hypothetical protein
MRAQIILIGAPKPMSIEAVLAAPNGGYARASHQSADHALQLRPGSGAAGCATPLCEASLFVSRARCLA